MDYDKIFADDINSKFFYSDYPGNKLVVGKISLKNAISRMSYKEFYTLVTYSEGETLPTQYIPYEKLSSDDGTLFATVNPDVGFFDICMDGKIQQISRLNNTENGSPRYLLGPGPDTVTMDELIREQYENFIGTGKSI